MAAVLNARHLAHTCQHAKCDISIAQPQTTTRLEVATVSLMHVACTALTAVLSCRGRL